ncbi:hypothetical protein Tco_0052921 [Tanacetum coccineum]
MSNTNTNFQTQTSNALHNAIMEAGGKDRPPMLTPGNYNPPYKFKWTMKTIPVAEGSSETTTKRYMKNYKNVSQDIQDQLNAEAKAVEIGESIKCFKNLETIYNMEFGKFTSRDGESLEFVLLKNAKVCDACKQKAQQAATRNRGKAIVNSPPPTYDQEPKMVAEDVVLSKEEIDKLMALISLSFKKIYKPTNNNLRTSSNTSTPVVQQSRIQEKMLLYKQEEAGFQLNDEQAHWRHDTDDEPEDQELEAHYLYMAQIQEIQNNDDDYNFLPLKGNSPQSNPESINDTYPVDQDEHNIIIDSLDMSYDREQDDQDDDDLAKERDLLASLIEKLKCEIDDSKKQINFMKHQTRL